MTNLIGILLSRVKKKTVELIPQGEVRYTWEDNIEMHLGEKQKLWTVLSFMTRENILNS
jgi:hypothetical protein